MVRIVPRRFAEALTDLKMINRTEPAYLPLEDAKGYSGLGKTSIYEKLKTQELEGRKFGKKLLISKASLDRMLAALPKFGEAA